MTALPITELPITALFPCPDRSAIKPTGDPSVAEPVPSGLAAKVESCGKLDHHCSPGRA